MQFELNPSVCESYFSGSIPRDFLTLCQEVNSFPFEPLSKEEAYHLVYKEGRGTDASKHAFLSKIALLHGRNDIELMAGIYYINRESCPSLLAFLDEINLAFIPSIRCYLRNQGERLDFSGLRPAASDLGSFMIREQSMDPHQAFDWKRMIYEDYVTRWLARTPNLSLTFEEIKQFQEEAILKLI
jgi:hypothetical protein